MGTWDVDLVTGVTTWSTGLRMLYGVDAQHPAGFEHFAALIHPDDGERVTKTLTEASARSLGVEFECRIVRPDGELRWILVRSTPRRAENGALVRVLGVAVDITKRKLAEEELVRSEELLRLAQAAGRLGAWDWNVETDELRWTPALYEINGVDPLSYQPTMQNAFDYVHPADRSYLKAELERVIASGESTYESLARLVRPSGEIRSVVNRGTVFRSEDEHVLTDRRGHSRRDRTQDGRSRARTARDSTSTGREAGGGRPTGGRRRA